MTGHELVSLAVSFGLHVPQCACGWTGAGERNKAQAVEDFQIHLDDVDAAAVA